MEARDARIVEAHKAGASTSELAELFGVSRDRIRQIAGRADRPRISEARRQAARSRWGPQRVVRLDSLHPNVAAAVRALIAADEASARRPIEQSWNQALDELTTALKRFALTIGAQR